MPAGRSAEWPGRKSELLLFSTLEREGSPATRATVATIHAATTSQRKRTVNRPRAANKGMVLQKWDERQGRPRSDDERTMCGTQRYLR